MVSRPRLHPSLNAPVAAGLLALLSGLLSGCNLPPPAGSPASSAIRETIEAQARAVFEAAILLKPRALEQADALAAGLAPLLFCEAPDSNAGAVPVPEVMFYQPGALMIAGRSFPQMSYLWRRPADAGWRGVRITLDSRGLPVIWEVLEARSQARPLPRVIFVAQSLEARARAAFGTPEAGGRFAVEAGGTPGSGVVVARLLEDGPALMGPEVYQNGAGEISAVTCRCMPPQVRRLVRTAWYELRPLPADEPEAAALLAALPSVAAILRLPPDF